MEKNGNLFIYSFIFTKFTSPPPLKKRGYLSAVLSGSCSENTQTMFGPVSSAVPSWTHRRQSRRIIPGKIVPPGRKLFSLIMADSSCASLPPSGHVVSAVIVTRTSVSCPAWVSSSAHSETGPDPGRVYPSSDLMTL